MAGLFDTPDAGQRPVPELVPAADWLQVRILLPDGPLMRHPDRASRGLTLDMRRGVLLTETRQTCNAPPRRPPAHVAPGVAGAARSRTAADRARIGTGSGDLTLEATFGPDGFRDSRPNGRSRICGLWRTWRRAGGLAIAAAASLQVDGMNVSPQHGAT